MPNQLHLDLLNQGVHVWNQWRRDYPKEDPDLNGADLRGAKLMQFDLSGVLNFSGTNLTNAQLQGADLSHAHLWRVELMGADFGGANLSNSCLVEADLSGANLTGAKLTSALIVGAKLIGTDLSGADLSESMLVGTSFRKAKLTGCRVFGVAVWDVDLAEAEQSNLIITQDPLIDIGGSIANADLLPFFPNYPVITVDNLKVAQFIHLLLNNEEIREVIDTIGQKGVLILGRFSQERKPVLDALREQLRTLNYLPIVFDFERPTQRDFTETIKTLAGLCCFIIADIANPKSSPLELQAIVPDYMIPFVPIIQAGEQPFSMFQDLIGKHDWVLDPLEYDTLPNLIENLEREVVEPALEKRDELLAKKVKPVRMRRIGENR